jgi:hypothetical protein
MSLKYKATQAVSLTPFADSTLCLQSLVLSVIPLGGDDGKAALKRRYPKWILSCRLPSHNR